MGKPGRPKKEKDSRPKKELLSDAKFLVALLKGQPLSKNELLNHPTYKLRKSTFDRSKERLIDNKVIKEVDGKFSLWNYEPLEAKLEECFRGWEREGLFVRTVSIDDLSNRVGESPDEVKRFAYKLARKYGTKIGKETDVSRPIKGLSKTPHLDDLSIFS